MAEDTNKKIGSLENEEPQKDWEWDAQVPDTPIDTVKIESFEIPEQKQADEEKTPVASDCCEICGEKLKNSPSEYYCEVCREKFLKVNYGASHIILSVVMMFVAVIGIVAFMTTSKIVTNVVEARNHIENQHLARAVDSYTQVDSTVKNLNDGFNAFLKGISANFSDVTVFDAGTVANKEIAEIMVVAMSSSYQDREAFLSLVESSFSEKELNSEKYAHVKECYDFCKAMNDTANDMYEGWYTLLDERMSAFDENGNLTKDDVPTNEEIIAYLDDYAKKHPEAEASTIEYYKVMTLYYEFASSDSIENTEIMSYLDSAYKKAGKFGYFYGDYYLSFAWECEDYDKLIRVAEECLKVNPANESAYFFLTKAYTQKNDLNKASGVCEEILKYNPDSLDYYALKAEVLRRTGDYSASADICRKGLKAGEDAELYRQAAIAYMLNEEKEKALEAAKTSYELAYAASYSGDTISLEALNTSALISYLCDEEKVIYEEVIKMFESEGYELHESIQKVIKGDITFEDLFTTGKGDL